MGAVVPSANAPYNTDLANVEAYVKDGIILVKLETTFFSSNCGWFTRVTRGSSAWSESKSKTNPSRAET